jgi:hypothetical protein
LILILKSIWILLSPVQGAAITTESFGRLLKKRGRSIKSLIICSLSNEEVRNKNKTSLSFV